MFEIPHTVVETEPFLRHAAALWSEKERQEFVGSNQGAPEGEKIMTNKKKLSPLARDILEGLHGALAHARGKPTPGTAEHVVLVPDVKAIRKALGLSQSEFSDTYNIPLATLKGWEQSRRHPDATSAAYLRTIALYPKETRRAQTAEIKTITRQHETHASPG